MTPLRALPARAKHEQYSEMPRLEVTVRWHLRCQWTYDGGRPGVDIKTGTTATDRERCKCYSLDRVGRGVPDRRP